MVTPQLWALFIVIAAQAQPKDQPALERLDPPTRVAVIMAILAIVLTGMALVAAAMIGAHWVRRMARHRPRNNAANADALASLQSERLRASLKSVLPEVSSGNFGNSGSTVQIDPAESDTKIDS